MDVFIYLCMYVMYPDESVAEKSYFERRITLECMAGTALMGIGQGKGKTRAVDAAMAAISSPLLDFPIAKAKGIIFNIVGGADMTLQEINRLVGLCKAEIL